MAQQERPDDLATLQELAVSSAHEIAVVVVVLERKGILARAEVLDEIKQLWDKSGEAR